MHPIRFLTSTTRTARRTATRTAIACAAVAMGSLCAALPVHAQTYTAVDLTPDSAWASAPAIDGVAGGYAGASSARTHAMLWDGTSAIDLHPSFVDDPVTGLGGRSAITGVSGALQVGVGYGPGVGNHQVPLAWSGDAATATQLPIPFTNAGGQATGTDGVQIVGYATGLNRDGTAIDTQHAMVWNAATGAATDLGDGGNGAQALGVGGGQQVGYVLKGGSVAALWKSTSRSLLVLHPTNAVTSIATGTDGVQQVGYAGYDVRVRVEAAKGNKTARFYYATVWSGTAASAVNIHPAPVNADPAAIFTNSFALGTSAGRVAGYATDSTRTNTPAYYHAIVWDAAYNSVDLNAFLPAGFTGAQALSVDADGTVSGVMINAAGQRHAVAWIPNP